MKYGPFLNFLLTFDGMIATGAVALAQFVPSTATYCHAAIALSASVGAVLMGIAKAAGVAPPDGVKS